MSFIKKIWKRGDKLTVKELNRIEEGIATGTGDKAILITGELASTESDIKLVINLSKTINEIISLLENNQLIKFKIFDPVENTYVYFQQSYDLHEGALEGVSYGYGFSQLTVGKLYNLMVAYGIIEDNESPQWVIVTIVTTFNT